MLFHQTLNAMKNETPKNTRIVYFCYGPIPPQNYKNT